MKYMDEDSNRVVERHFDWDDEYDQDTAFFVVDENGYTVAGPCHSYEDAERKSATLGDFE